MHADLYAFTSYILCKNQMISRSVEMAVLVI